VYKSYYIIGFLCASPSRVFSTMDSSPLARTQYMPISVFFTLKASLSN